MQEDTTTNQEQKAWAVKSVHKQTPTTSFCNIKRKLKVVLASTFLFFLLVETACHKKLPEKAKMFCVCKKNHTARKIDVGSVLLESPIKNPPNKK